MHAAMERSTAAVPLEPTSSGKTTARKSRSHKASLSPFRATVLALLGRDIDHYPRVFEGGKSVLLDTDVMMREFGAASAPWGRIVDADGCDRLDDAIKLARQSLDEVKGQTEYQDQKATRLLTVTTFLTAFSGVLFTRVLDAHPYASFGQQPFRAAALLWVSDGLFVLAILSAVFGALITFHATRTRFKYVHADETSKDAGDPRSRLFYRGILHVRPSAWASAYVADAADGEGGPTVRADLKQAYLQDLVGETYLIAAKTADKLRFLDPAQRLLARSLTFLATWLCSLILVATFVAPVPRKATAVRLEDPTLPFPVTAQILPAVPSPPPPSTTSPQRPPASRLGGAAAADSEPPPSPDVANTTKSAAREMNR